MPAYNGNTASVFGPDSTVIERSSVFHFSLPS